MERGGFHGYRKNIISNNNTTTTTSEVNNNSHSGGGGGGGGGSSQDGAEMECTVREQDRFMPIANVIRIMRKILPPHAKISDDAKETIQECVSEYISFITGEANERCQREQRKTITAEDVLWAMSKLGFDDYVEPLTLFLHRYREAEGDRSSSSSSTTNSSSASVSAAVLGPSFYMRGPPPPPPPSFAAYYASMMSISNSNAGSNGFYSGGGVGPAGTSDGLGGSHAHLGHGPV